jgi:acetylornithine deacetylase/succinyl-diaminopimelate desuccinylase-like protein
MKKVASIMNKSVRKPMAVSNVRAAFLLVSAMTVGPFAQAAQPDWDTVDAETLQQFQAMLRIDTSNPPGNETELANHVAAVLQQEGIEVQLYSKDPQRANLVARLRGSGKKQPLLLMAHLDVVTVDPTKWSFPPFGATLDEQWIYGRGTLDDKDNLVASMMTLLLLKRSGIALDRDVILLAEAGEEGGMEFGIDYMVNQQFAAIDAEFCLAEGGSVQRVGGQPLYAGIQTSEKKRRTAILTSTGVAGHGSVPTRTNAVARLSKAVAAIAEWQEQITLNDTTTAFLSRLADVSAPEAASRYRALLNPGSPAAATALEYLLDNEPGLAAVLHNTVTPTIINIGYRYNVIPSEGTATLDVRLLPEQDFDSFLDNIRSIINDPSIDVAWDTAIVRPSAVERLNTEAFRVIEELYQQHYQVPVLPTMGTGATDMSFLRAKGMSCYGVGAGTDREDGPLGFGAHSDQERILETELYKFVHVYYDIVERLAAVQP